MYKWLENLTALITKNSDEQLFLSKTPEVHERIEEIVKKTGSDSQVEVIRKGLTLIDVACRAYESGGRIAVIENPEGKFHTLSGFVVGDEAPLQGVTTDPCRRDFPVIVRQQNLPDGVYLALCPMLPGAIGQGNSRAEALQTITEDIQRCLQDGDQPIQVDFVTVEHPPKPKASA